MNVIGLPNPTFGNATENN
ncbi:hypothetical protein ABZS88_40715 [Streptomyces sp. NPDC005480]